MKNAENVPLISFCCPVYFAANGTVTVISLEIF